MAPSTNLLSRSVRATLLYVWISIISSFLQGQKICGDSLLVAEAFVARQSTVQKTTSSTPHLHFRRGAHALQKNLSIIAQPISHKDRKRPLHLLPPELLLSSSDTESSLKPLAQTLGYLLGGASLLLYTPIAVRIIRQKSADGLAVSTWWFKLSSFTCTDVYNIKRGFPLAAFSETLVITVEAVLVLSLVSFYQCRLNKTTFSLAAIYLSIAIWAIFSPPDASWGPSQEGIAFAQVLATFLNIFALVPQLIQNYQRKSSGDYSAITTTLASVGCIIRLFTTMELADGDLLLLLNYGMALLLNMSVLSQVLWYGTQEEGKSVVSLYLADVKSKEKEVDLYV